MGTMGFLELERAIVIDYLCLYGKVSLLRILKKKKEYSATF